MRRSMVTAGALLSFLLGVGLFLGWQPLGREILVGIGFSVVLMGFWRKLWPGFGWIGLGGLFFFLGMGRALFSVHQTTPTDVDFYNGEEVMLEGIVRSVDVRQNQVKYTVETSVVGPVGEGFSTSSDFAKLRPPPLRVEGKVLVTLNRYPRYQYGDKLRLQGQLREPGVVDRFNYGNYLSRYKIYSVLYWPKEQRLATDLGHPLWAQMVRWQDHFLFQIGRLFPEPYASFEAGLLVGARRGIPKELMEQFNATGLTHILAISGYNISLIILVVLGLLRPLPRRFQFGMALGAIFFFTLFVGASPAVVRASLMGGLVLLALHKGRQSQVHLTVIFAAFLMVLWNPKVLWWDAGFQLSFAAVLGLVYLVPWFEPWTQKLPQALGVKEAIQMTLAAQIAALPIVLYNFDRLSLVAPLSNLLVVFALPPAMALGLGAVLLSFFSFPLGLLLAYAATLVLSYLITVIELTAALPYASLHLPGMSLWWMIGYYGLLIGLLIWKSKRVSPNNPLLEGVVVVKE